MQNLIKTQNTEVLEIKTQDDKKVQKQDIKKLVKVKEGIKMSKRSNCC